MKATYIDNSWFRISQADAKRLCGKLPAYGHARLVLIQGIEWWVQRTELNGKTVWAIHADRLLDYTVPEMRQFLTSYIVPNTTKP